MIKEWTNKHLKGDPVIWFIVFALSVLSILVVYSATGTLAYTQMGGDTEHYLFKHSVLYHSELVLAMTLWCKIDVFVAYIVINHCFIFKY